MFHFEPISDMFESGGSIFIQMELAGVNKEDIDIELKGRYIEITGIKRHGGLSGEESFQRMERPFGFFKRIFNLPPYVDANSITASFREGVLEIIIPRNRNIATLRICGINIR